MCIPMPLCFFNPLYTCNIQLSFRSKMYTAKECERMLNTKHGTNLFTNRTNAGNTVKIWRLTLFEKAWSIKHRFMSLLHSLAGICIVCKIQIIQFISHIKCFNKALQFKKKIEIEVVICITLCFSEHVHTLHEHLKKKLCTI